MKIPFNEIGTSESEQFHSMLLEEIHNSGDEMLLDFENVEKISLSGIQILVSLNKYCEENHKIIRCINVTSEQMMDAIDTYNLVNKLGVEQ